MNAQPSRAGGEPAVQRGRRLRDASLVTVVMVASTALGLVRDIVLAALFGASEASDAFFVAWTVPETVTPLVTESGLGLVLVPLFARAWASEGSLTSAVRRTVLPAVGTCVLGGAVVALSAPLAVDLLAPGLAEPELAVTCFRWASITVLGLGLAGYLESALRGRASYVRAASMYVAYNVGILGCLLLTPVLGVEAAAIGLAVGSVLMVAVLWPAVARSTELTGLRWRGTWHGAAALAVVLPLVAYSLARQGQVFAERYFGSGIPGGISQLNYASKVAQVPVGIAEVFAVVTVAAVTGHLLRDRRPAARVEVHGALRNGLCLVLPATVGLVVLAPGVIGLLFGRGAFAGAATEATATVMRWYALGLPGQFLVGATVLFLCIERRGASSAARAAAGCLAVTIGIDALTVGPMGVGGLAIGNAAGITVAAAVLVHRLHRDLVPLSWGSLADAAARSTGAAAGAGLVVVPLVLWTGTGAVATVLAGIVFLVVHVALAHLIGLEEVRALTA